MLRPVCLLADTYERRTSQSCMSTRGPTSLSGPSTHCLSSRSKPAPPFRGTYKIPQNTTKYKMLWPLRAQFCAVCVGRPRIGTKASYGSQEVPLTLFLSRTLTRFDRECDPSSLASQGWLPFAAARQGCSSRQDENKSGSSAPGPECRITRDCCFSPPGSPFQSYVLPIGRGLLLVHQRGKVCALRSVPNRVMNTFAGAAVPGGAHQNRLVPR